MSLARLKEHDLIYLASPYSDYLEGTEEAFRCVSEIAGYLLTQGASVLSPIAHSHPLTVYGNVPNDYKIWLPYDFKLLDRCDALCVALMTGWETSKGVRAEIDRARGVSKAVYYVHPYTLEVF